MAQASRNDDDKSKAPEAPKAPVVPDTAETGAEEQNSDVRSAATVDVVEEYNPGHNEPEPLKAEEGVAIQPAVFNEADEQGYVNVSPEYKRFRGPEADTNPDVEDLK